MHVALCRGCVPASRSARARPRAGGACSCRCRCLALCAWTGGFPGVKACIGRLEQRPRLQMRDCQRLGFFVLLTVWDLGVQGFRSPCRPRREGAVRFGELLQRVAAVDPELRVRFTSPHPKDFSDDVLQACPRSGRAARARPGAPARGCAASSETGGAACGLRAEHCLMRPWRILPARPASLRVSLGRLRRFAPSPRPAPPDACARPRGRRSPTTRTRASSCTCRRRAGPRQCWRACGGATRAARTMPCCAACASASPRRARSGERGCWPAPCRLGAGLGSVLPRSA